MDNGGVLFVNTYNYKSFGKIIFGKRWREFCPPYHCNYFNKKILKDAIRAAGFDIILFRAMGISYYEESYGFFGRIIINFISKVATLLNLGDALEIVAIKIKTNDTPNSS